MSLLGSFALGGLLALLLAADPARAQCVVLGTPGQTGCTASPLLLAPSIDCGATSPTVGNLGFRITGGGFQAPVACPPGGPIFVALPFLAVGACDSTPLLLLGGRPPLCASAPLGCTAFVEFAVPFALVGPILYATGGVPQAMWILPIPREAGLIGLTLCVQALQGTFACPVLPGLPSCFALSNGLSITILS